MTRRLRFLSAWLLAGVVVSGLLFPIPRAVVLGFLRGERFYQGMPTSYWSKRIREGPFPYSSGEIVQVDYRTWVPATSVDELKSWLGLQHTVAAFQYPLRENDPEAIPVLIELLKDPSSTVRMYAAETLGAFGPRAVSALPTLSELLDDKEFGGFGISVGERAAEALKKIESEPAVDGGPP